MSPRMYSRAHDLAVWQAIGRLPARWLMGAGYLVGPAGMCCLTRLTVENAY